MGCSRQLSWNSRLIRRKVLRVNTVTPRSDRNGLANSLILAIGIGAVSIAAYASLYLFRNTWWDVIWFVAFVPIATLLTAVLSLRDLVRRGSRKQGFVALLLLIPPFWLATKLIHAVVH